MEKHNPAEVPHSVDPLEQRLTNVFHKSFKYSQGSVELQKVMFVWLDKSDYLLPFNNLLTKNIPQPILQITSPQSHPGTLGKMGSVTQKYGIENVWYHLTTFTKGSELTLQQTEANILLLMLNQDAKYQRTSRPRITKPEVTIPDSPLDEHASFIRKYALNGVTTGTEEYDALFRSLKTQLLNLQSGQTVADKSMTRQIQKQLTQLVKNWNKNHPGHSFLQAATEK